MKRLLQLLPLLLCLCGCSASHAAPPKTEPVPPPVITIPTATTLPSIPAEQAISTEVESAAALSSPVTDETREPTTPTGPIIPWQPGDTTPTWKPELAEGYPADEACDADLLLEKWMTVEGLSCADLDVRNCRQLILAAAQPTDGVETITVCYERTDEGDFVPVPGLERLHGFVGKNGVMHNRRRNTDTSPAGLWAIGMAFGNQQPPEGLKLPWRQVTPNSDWVCDEASPYFNTWQERDDPTLIPWSDDVEHLENYPTLYAWACVIEFNRPPDVIPDRGCAIFLHCSEGGTGGCVGLLREDMGAVLQWLDPEKHPCILITGVNKQ